MHLASRKSLNSVYSGRGGGCRALLAFPRAFIGCEVLLEPTQAFGSMVSMVKPFGACGCCAHAAASLCGFDEATARLLHF